MPPAWASGAITGVVLWLVAAIVSYVLKSGVIAVIVFPVGQGGWWFVWGDADPPFAWLNALWFNVLFAICLYGGLGALIGRFIGKRRDND